MNKRTNGLAVLCALVAGTAGPARADIEVEWHRTVAPNVYGASSWDQFWANAQDSVINMGGADNGTGNSAFLNITEVDGINSYVTSFESRSGAFEAGEYGVRPSWVYYIHNADGSPIDNGLLQTATKNYSYSWDGQATSFWGDIAFGGFDADTRVGVRADGSVGVDPNDTYVGFLVVSGNAWWAQNWTGTLGVDHQWIDGDYLVGNPERFDKLAQLGAYTGAHQDHWAFSITIGGQQFDAPNINVVPTPASLALLGLGGVAARRRRR